MQSFISSLTSDVANLDFKMLHRSSVQMDFPRQPDTFPSKGLKRSALPLQARAPFETSRTGFCYTLRHFCLGSATTMNIVGRAACFLGFILFLMIKEDSINVNAWVPTVATPRPSQLSLRATSDRVSPPRSSNPLLETLLDWFQGDFDNYRQVVSDRQEGFLPREFGGHEHIHCCLIPVTPSTRLAAFYFDGIPNAIFRFRFYRLEQHSPDAVDTILYTLSKELELKLRACSDAMQWPVLFREYISERTAFMEAYDGIGDECKWVEAAIQQACVTLLPNCEVRWSFQRDAIQHAYVDSDAEKGGIHAVMVHGEALVDSQMIPGQKILIRDQLSLWKHQLWIHDRGLDPVTGAFIYGNQKGIPYRMQRVTHIVGPDNDSLVERSLDTPPARMQRRQVTDPDLAWTLGNDYRTAVEYETNMQVIGGSSRK
jgi:CpeT/CpcT family (DUF1001)